MKSKQWVTVYYRCVRKYSSSRETCSTCTDIKKNNGFARANTKGLALRARWYNRMNVAGLFVLLNLLQAVCVHDSWALRELRGNKEKNVFSRVSWPHCRSVIRLQRTVVWSWSSSTKILGENVAGNTGLTCMQRFGIILDVKRETRGLTTIRLPSWRAKCVRLLSSIIRLLYTVTCTIVLKNVKTTMRI